ncbi:hypothetical protein CHS0354_026513 [Potamilus streckersoni]|uniref:HMG box domain-containing protein n=1 Tax=Potamilus streckersoni TaxID=2493646 RepID=A0AAE0VI33_9BIVA|nr:hypothetical protein CHS0354_026513 [Potamilus streckersoni]
MSAPKRKRIEDDILFLTPGSKMQKQEEVTRSGRVRKKPAKFFDPEEVYEPELQVEHVLPCPDETKMEDPPMVADASPEPDISLSDDMARSSGRVRKKSAKVREMEEFEEIEKKQFSKKTPIVTSQKAQSQAEPVFVVSSPKKPKTKQAMDIVPAVSPSVNFALAAKLQAPNPQTAAAILSKVKAKAEPVVLSVKSTPTIARSTTQNATAVAAQMAPMSSPVKSAKLTISQPVGGSNTVVSPTGVKTAIEPGQMIIKTKSPQGSVIKLLLNSPTQQNNPVVSTKAITQTSSSPEAVPASGKKKAKEKKGATSENQPNIVSALSNQTKQTNELEIPHLKLLLGSVPQMGSPIKHLAGSSNPLLASTILSQTIKSNDPVKTTHLASPRGQVEVQTIDNTEKFAAKKTPGTNKPQKEQKQKKQKKAKQGSAIELGITTIPHNPPEILLGGSPDGKSSRKKKPKLTAELVTTGEKELLNDADYGLDVSEVILGGEEEENQVEGEEEEMEDEESFMDIEGDDDDDDEVEEGELIIAHETAPPKQKVNKKKAKPKGGKTRTNSSDSPTQFGDLSGSGEPLVMDLDKIKTDEKKKSLKKKPKEQPDQDKNKKKRAPTAYMIWCNIHRPKLVEENPRIDFATVSKRLGEMWSNLSEKEKMVWRRKAKKLAGRGSTLITTGKIVSGKTISGKQVTAAQPTVTLSSSGAVKGTTPQVATGAKAGKSSTSEEPFSPVKGFGSDPVDVAAHLKLIGESLSIIGMRLQEHRGLIAVQGSLSVLLDSMLCAFGPLMCLTQQLPELDGCLPETHLSTLENIAYVMPGL